MSQLQDKFNAIVKRIEERFTDPDELNFIKKQIADIAMLYMDEVNKIMDYSEKRINQVYENQKILEQKIAQVENGMNNIEKELYIEDEDYDFEIICPYCNHEFVSDNIASNVKEIECPECHNIIELDWNEEENEGCSGGSCSICNGCGNDTEKSSEDNELKEDDNDDDM